MGGKLSCTGKSGHVPADEDCTPYGIPQERTYDGSPVQTTINTDPPVPPSPYHNNNNDFKENKISLSSNGGPQWRFWQHLSMRRSKRKQFSKKYLSVSHTAEDVDSSVILPDVVEREGGFQRTKSLQAPPKPPRLFLFRSSTISTPRNSVIENQDRNSRIFAQSFYDSDIKNIDTGITCSEVIKTDGDQNGCIDKVENESYATKTAGTVDIGMPDLSPDIIIPDNVILKTSSLPYQKRNKEVSSGHWDRSVSNKIRIVSPELSRKLITRPRKKSGEITADDRHILILQSATELICQKLDPFMVMEDMTKADILCKDDLTAYRGHPDRRLICENIVQAVMERDYLAFVSFCDILRSITDYTMVAAVLDAMRAVYDVIYEVSMNTSDSSPILDDEKTVSFDVVYFSLESGKIRSVVELEKSRNGENRRYSRDILSSKRNSRLSFHSLTSEASSVFNEDLVNNGIPMVTAAVAGHNLSCEKARALASVIEQHSCVLELHLGKTHLKGPDFHSIGLALSQSSCLRVLDLRLNNIGNEGAAHLANALMRNRSLRQMNLSSTGMDSDGCKLICESLKTNTSLIEIDLSFLDIGESGCVCISDMLKQNRSLKKIRLRSSGVSWLGCGFLLEGIEQGKTVTELDLSRNFIGDDGIKMFHSHMKDDSSLRDLNLENCGFTSAGCSVLSDVIQTNKSIRNLDLSANFVGDLGILKLSNALVRNKHIKTLGFNMCGISNDGFSKLLDILESNTTLTLLKLCYNRLGKEHVNPEATSDNLKYRIRIVTSSNPKLKLLLWGNSFDESQSLEQLSAEITAACKSP